MNLLFLCIAGFCALFVDAISGGGGLISLPAYLIFGLPYKVASGTNKLSSTMGTSISAFNYFKNGQTNLRFLKLAVPANALGAICGVLSLLAINPDFLKKVIPILLIIVAIYTLFKKNIGAKDEFKGFNKKNYLLGILLAFSLGFYDGFFGPGTGSFLILGIIFIFKFDMLKSSGIAKALNLTSNLVSLVIFSINKSIDLRLGLLVGVFCMLGGFLGSKLAIKNGAKIIRPLMVLVSISMALKLIFFP